MTGFQAQTLGNERGGGPPHDSLAPPAPSLELRAIAANAGDDAARSLREAMEAAQSAGARRSADFYRGALLMALQANRELVVPVEDSAA